MMNYDFGLWGGTGTGTGRWDSLFGCWARRSRQKLCFNANESIDTVMPSGHRCDCWSGNDCREEDFPQSQQWLASRHLATTPLFLFFSFPFLSLPFPSFPFFAYLLFLFHLIRFFIYIYSIYFYLFRSIHLSIYLSSFCLDFLLLTPSQMMIIHGPSRPRIVHILILFCFRWWLGNRQRPSLSPSPPEFQ